MYPNLHIDIICLCINSLGFTTDGEFNSLRTMGIKRPISVIDLIKGAKRQARSIHVKTIFSYFQLDEKGELYQGNIQRKGFGNA